MVLILLLLTGYAHCRRPLSLRWGCWFLCRGYLIAARCFQMCPITNNKTTLWGPGLDFYWFLVDFGTHGYHLACLEPLLWRPGGPWDDPGAILGRSWDDPGKILGHWRAQGRTLWGPGLDFVDFLMILGTHSESFFGIFSPNKKIFSCLFSGCFFCWFLGLNLNV